MLTKPEAGATNENQTSPLLVVQEVAGEEAEGTGSPMLHTVWVAGNVANETGIAPAQVVLTGAPATVVNAS